MATKSAATKKHYIVVSPEGEWHYAPVDATSPEEAVRFSDPTCQDVEALQNTYHVHEIVSTTPVILEPTISLRRI